MTDKHEILGEVARLFRAFPAGKNVDEHTLQDFCELFAPFEYDVISQVVNDFRLGTIKRASHSFPPALPEVAQALRRRAPLKKAMNNRGRVVAPKPRYQLPPNHFMNQTIQKQQSNKEA